MIGYPYSYGNDINDIFEKDENFISFSLTPVSEDSELSLAHASSLPICIEPGQLELGDKFTFRIVDEISQVCGKFEMIPETQTLVIDYNGYREFAYKSDEIITTISCDLGITKQSAMEQTHKFFSDRTVVVQCNGIQGAIYTAGSYLQSAGSAGLVTHTIGLAKLAGAQGWQILQAQPALAIAIPTTGAIFFYGCGAIAGNNTIGKALVTTGDILALPMKGVEIMWNTYANPAIQQVFGIPVILNMTQTFKTGPGYTFKEIQNYIAPPNKTSLVRYIKDGVIKWLSS